MRLYKTLSLVSALLVTIPGIGSFEAGVSSRNWLLAGLSISVVVFWWYAVYRLKQGSLMPSLMMNGVMMALVLLQLYITRSFVITNGGWERADGYGSPMAFLIGLVFDILSFLYFFASAMLGLRILARQKALRRPADDQSGSEN